MFEYREKILLDCDELIQTELTCPICSETYDRSLHLPKSLNCCHSICLDCLGLICSQSEAASRRSFPCPMCRNKIKILTDGVWEFRTNHSIIRLLDRIDNREVVPECPKHPLEELQYCEPCDAVFCDSCDDKSHCNEDSATLVHSVRRFAIAIKRKSSVLTSEANKWVSELDDADKKLTFLEKNIQEKINNALKNYDSFSNKITTLMKKRRQEVENLLREIKIKKFKTINDQKQWIADEKAEVTAGFKRFKHQGTVAEVKKKTEELRLRVESKKESLIPKENCVLRYVENNQIAESVQRYIMEFGGCETTKTLPSLCEARIGKCFAGMSTVVTIITKDFSGNNYYGNDLDDICAIISTPGNDTSLAPFINDEGDGNYGAHFTIQKSGICYLKVKIFGHPIKNHPLRFKVESYRNSVYNNENGEICRTFMTKTQCVRLTANQKEIRIDSHGWTVGTESASPPKPKYCRPLNVPEIECATTSLDCPDSPWMCGGNSFWKISLDGEKERILKKFSLPGSLNCIALVPGYTLSSEPIEIDSNSIKLKTTTCFIREDISINKARSRGVFGYKIINFSHINDTVTSPSFFVRNIQWNILAAKHEAIPGEEDSVKTLGVYLECKGCPESSTWSCKVEGELKLIPHSGGEPLTRTIEQVFKHDVKNWGYRPFAIWNDILDPSKGYIENDSIFLEVSMSADEPQGVSEDFMEDADYVSLEKQVATSALLFDSFSFSDGADVLTRGKESLSVQDFNQITEIAENLDLEETLIQQKSLSTCLESTSKQDSNIQSLRTLWIGSDDGTVHIVSAEDQGIYSSIKMELPDSVVQIIHSRGKVFIALSNGQCCVFIRSQENLCWNFSEYFLVDISVTNSKRRDTSCTDEPASTTSLTVGRSKDSVSSEGRSLSAQQNLTISCMEAIETSIWFASQESIYILDCESLKIVSQLKVNESEAQIDKLTATENGVWCSYHSPSDQKIQLFSTNEPYDQVLSIDIHPDLKKMLIPLLNDSELNSIARITALKASNGHLWVGTAAGIVVCIPFKFTSTPTESKCDVSQAQLSLHGFGKAVKFFLPLNYGMISGGEGYRDLMIDPDAGTSCVLDEYHPHIILWE